MSIHKYQKLIENDFNFKNVHNHLHQIQLLFCNSEFTMHKQILKVLTNKLECYKNNLKCLYSAGIHTPIWKASATHGHPGLSRYEVQWKWQLNWRPSEVILLRLFPDVAGTGCICRVCGEEYNKCFSPVNIPWGSLVSRPYLHNQYNQIICPMFSCPKKKRKGLVSAVRTCT